MKAITHVMGDWLPLPTNLINGLQWKEGAVIHLELTEEGVLLTYQLHEDHPDCLAYLANLRKPRLRPKS